MIMYEIMKEPGDIYRRKIKQSNKNIQKDITNKNYGKEIMVNIGFVEYEEIV